MTTPAEVFTARSSPEARAQGKRLRADVPRRTLGSLVPSTRPALDILREQNADRVPDLIPLRFARMAADPFSYYRGSAAVMAADLAAGPTTGLDVVSCGDAHLSNVGLFAAPNRSLVLDLNDFDETAFAPAEWDVKRLATSAVVAARHLGLGDRVARQAAAGSVSAYRRSLAELVRLAPLRRYYLRVEATSVPMALSSELRRLLDRAIRKARDSTSDSARAKLTRRDDHGIPRLRESPPLLRAVDAGDLSAVTALIDEYRASVPIDVAVLLGQYELTDVALRVVGVGSVGTRCYVAILSGPDRAPLVLQLKQAATSVLAQYGARPQPDRLTSLVARGGDGARVVAGQRVMQAASDVFLGTIRRNGVDYYVRQFRDMKGSIDLTPMNPASFVEYATGCGSIVARAHAQSANAVVFSGYLGRGQAGMEALVAFAFIYADKSAADHQQLLKAISSGEIEAAADSL